MQNYSKLATGVQSSDNWLFFHEFMTLIDFEFWDRSSWQYLFRVNFLVPPWHRLLSCVQEGVRTSVCHGFDPTESGSEVWQSLRTTGQLHDASAAAPCMDKAREWGWNDRLET